MRLMLAAKRGQKRWPVWPGTTFMLECSAPVCRNGRSELPDLQLA